MSSQLNKQVEKLKEVLNEVGNINFQHIKSARPHRMATNEKSQKTLKMKSRDQREQLDMKRPE